MNSSNFKIINNILILIIKSIYYIENIHTILTLNQNYINNAISNVNMKYKNIIDDIDTYVILIYIEYLFINIDLISDNYLLNDIYIYDFNMLTEQIKIDDKLIFDPNIIMLILSNNQYIKDTINIAIESNKINYTNKQNKFKDIVDLINYPDIKSKIKRFEDNQKRIYDIEYNNLILNKINNNNNNINLKKY